MAAVTDAFGLRPSAIRIPASLLSCRMAAHGPPDLGPRLISAATSNDEAAVEDLIRRGVDVDVVDQRHAAEGTASLLTSLMWACRNGAVGLAKRLLDAGASLHAEDAWGRQALAHASECGHVTCVRLLLGHGLPLNIDVNNEDLGGWTALARAAKGGHEECVAVLIQGGALPTKFSVKAALSSGHAGIAELMKGTGELNSEQRQRSSSLVQDNLTFSDANPQLESLVGTGTFSELYRCQRDAGVFALKLCKPFQSSVGSSSSDMARARALLLEIAIGRAATGCPNLQTLYKAEYWKYDDEVQKARRTYDPAKDIGGAETFGGPNDRDESGNSIHRTVGIPDWWWWVALQFELATYNLEDVVRSSARRKACFSSRRERKAVAGQILAGLLHMHEILGVAHRDVQPKNVLCFVDGAHPKARYRLCGFGSVAPLGSKRSRKQGLGPLPYRPPELVDAAVTLPVIDVVGPRHDLWAAGCVCQELLNGTPMIPAEGVGHYTLLHSNLALMPRKSGDKTIREYRVPKGASRSHGEEGFLLTMLADKLEARPPDVRAALALQWITGSPQSSASPQSPQSPQSPRALQQEKARQAAEAKAKATQRQLPVALALQRRQELSDLLEAAGLNVGAHLIQCLENDIESGEALQDASNEALLGMGFTKVQIKKLRRALSSSLSSAYDDSAAGVREAPRGVISDSSTLNNTAAVEANDALKSRPINQSFYKNFADIEAATTNESLQMLIDYHVLRDPVPISLIPPLPEKPISPSAMTSHIAAELAVLEVQLPLQVQEQEQQGGDVPTSRTIFRMLPAFTSEKGRVTPIISPTMDNDNDGNNGDFPELLKY